MEIFQVFLIAFFSIFFFVLCCGCFAFIKEQDRRRRITYESAQSILSLYRPRQRQRRRQRSEHSTNPATNSRLNMNSFSGTYNLTPNASNIMSQNPNREMYPPIFIISPNRLNDSITDDYQKYSNDLPTYEQVFGHEKPK